MFLKFGKKISSVPEFAFRGDNLIFSGEGVGSPTSVLLKYLRVKGEDPEADYATYLPLFSSMAGRGTRTSLLDFVT